MTTGEELSYFKKGFIHMQTQAKEKKKWKTPHTFVILVVIILIAVAATYIVPAVCKI